MSTRNDWLKFRLTGIGSSDLPIILGISPWKTPLELWKDKTGRTPLESAPNFPQQHGITLEPMARAAYELLNDLDMPPQVFRHPVHEFMIASLDGWNEKFKRTLEIKCPLGAADHLVAKEGKIPEKYEWQVRHQLFVTDAELADYFSYFQPKPELVPDYCLVQMGRDHDKEKWMLSQAEAFWRLVQTDVPPPLSSRDYLEVTDPGCVRLVEDWKVLRVAGKSRALDQVRAELRKYLVHPRVECAGVRLMEVSRKNGPTLEVRLKGES